MKTISARRPWGNKLVGKLPLWRPVPNAQALPPILLAFASLLFFQGISTRTLWASHEARAAQNAQRMLDDGNWLLPRLYDGQVELQKPPGFYWLVAAAGSFRGGVDEVAVRLPAVLAGLLTVFLVWNHLRRRGRPVAGFVAGAMLAGAVHFTGTARIGRIDVPLACIVTAIMLVSRDAIAERETRIAPGRKNNQWRAGSRERPEEPAEAASDCPGEALGALTRPRSPLRLVRALAGLTFRAPIRKAFASRLTVVAIGLLAGIALLLKGPIGIVLPAAALFAMQLVERAAIRSLVRPAMLAGVVAVSFALPWYLWANAATDGKFFRVFFLYHHFNRAFGGAEALAGHPVWFYLPRFASDFLPWTPLLLVAIWARRWRGDADARFGLIWFAVMFAVLSCSRFKRADYLLPAYPGAAIFLGCAVERWYRLRSMRAKRWFVAGFAVVLALLPAWWLGFDRIVTAKEQAARNVTPFADRVRELAPRPETVVLFRVESHPLAFQLGRPVHTLVEWADLDALLREPGPHYVITRVEFEKEVREHTGRLEVVARSEQLARTRQHRPFILLRFDGKSCLTPPRD